MYHASYCSSYRSYIRIFSIPLFQPGYTDLAQGHLYVGILLRVSSKSMPKYRLKGTRVVTTKLAPFCRPLLPTEIHQTLVLGCAIR